MLAAMQKNIRNFCIIAHIDHGKSTLADRILELTKTVADREMKEQLLDQMDLERERGITIKLQPVRMAYTKDGQEYTLNLIDTPGHVDFTYEVSRSLQACEGAILVVDASQGIQAQTLANLYLAIEQDLTIIPVLNKIDLPAADVPRRTHELVTLLGCKEEEIISVSAKTGENVLQILDSVVDRIPGPRGNETAPTRALIFDSVYDDYRGVITYVRVIDGSLKKGDKVLLMEKGTSSEALEVGVLKPAFLPTNSLEAGQIGYVVTGFKGVEDARVGDTMTLKNQPAELPLPGYKEVMPMVYAGIYAKDSSKHEVLREAMGRLKLNDAALAYEAEHSVALGFGFRCGFLGMLHLDIISERLRREFDLDLIVTTPSVAYTVYKTNGDRVIISSPLDLPDPTFIDHIEEPIMATDIVTPAQYIGGILKLLNERRGEPAANEMEYIDEERVILHYTVPLSGLVVDFYDKLKNVSSGYASLNYEFKSYKQADIVRMDILVAEDIVGPLASMVYRASAASVGRKVVSALKDLLPRQMFQLKIQAAVGGKIVASERVSAIRKDVTAGLYGGDVTRKRKLLEKQKKGKKRMMQQGKVDIPQDAFLAILKR
ncbi:MAG: elongation factor 4 [Candidatus Kerfeldbacteria bacterium CG15_BIG_FIL_POST_REV_8_21_14_020_45_12]|uniref:Elongation factor 4 n=1 Tax=Candidatus Kerfeldbacteria bacterium CG15_BIG_FIL_POST_REV_8_21_14_020_45_12 TaxID=2014247 RepID=A0A2M7H4R9_9BACT|nr:MAG: elongation factor 4 [Candidatus Kerfeldbacteria bacterium CG15_BIG_FIL_POST_REV_8_21_14_020_45_12]PJA93573.1 MAG: elongation factor 4 [Candidatus Kerfeldbacteria bacterium CG_4_9_14_3_um_filter_45_8]